MAKLKILVFDDELSEIGKLYIGLLLKDFIVEATTDPTEITSRVERMQPNIVVVNHDAEGFNPSEVCAVVKTAMNIPIILLLEKNSAATMNIDGCSADDAVFKPVDVSELVQKIKNLAIMNQ